MRQMLSIARRVLFVCAFAFAGLAVWEKAANLTGRTLVFLAEYEPSQLLQWAVVALLFVIALELRDIMHGTAGGAGPR
jgi:hypothetical protein